MIVSAYNHCVCFTGLMFCWDLVSRITVNAVVAFTENAVQESKSESRAIVTSFPKYRKIKRKRNFG